ncbi:interleukin-6 receptor subunit beta [Anableps anableps]
MERSLAMVWTCLLGAALALAFSAAASKTVPQPPRLIRCVFIIQCNITCHWEPGNHPATYYTLKVERIPSLQSPNSSRATFTCTTSGLSCTAGISGSAVRIEFCISIISHGVDGNVSSVPRCQPGRIEAILAPAILNSVEQVNGSSQCLNVSWSRDLILFPVSETEIKNGSLNSQILFAPKGEVNAQVRNVTVTGLSFLVCLFKPDTLYMLKLRHRYLGPASPWSQWSNPVEGKTAEDAPTAAPVLWREVGHTSSSGWRLISLLWKPLPHFQANGRVNVYSVICKAENYQILNDYGSCTNLKHANTSCSWPLPAGRCFCSLKASTSAGTSPESWVWIPGSSEKELPPPVELTATPLGNSSMEVRWRSPPNLLVSGFVVEWFAVREKTSSVLHWEKLNSSCTNHIVAEGVKPMERYAVSVKALYGEKGAGKNITLHVYTQEGMPSAGPNVQVKHISDSSVDLSWSSVPVEQLRGFIRNYTLFYSTKNQPANSITVPGHVHHYTLENMSPGIYDIFICASTIAGTGPAGDLVNVHIGSEEISIVICVIIPLLLISVVLMLMVLLAQMKMVKKKFFHRVPNPSNSTLSQWNPETSLESKKLVVEQDKPEVSYPEVILLDKRQALERAHSYLHICKPQLSHDVQPSSSPAKGSEIGYISNMTKTQSVNDLSTRPCIYSTVLCSQFNQNLPTPLLPSSYQVSQNGNACINDIKQPADGDTESSDEQGAFKLFLKEIQSNRSLSDFSRTSLLSHQTDFPRLNSMLSMYKNTPSHSFASTFSSFPTLAFVDLSSCSVQCGPYISSEK